MTFLRVKTESSLTKLFQVRLAEALPASPMGSRVVINNSSCTSEIESIRKLGLIDHGSRSWTGSIFCVALLTCFKVMLIAGTRTVSRCPAYSAKIYFYSAKPERCLYRMYLVLRPRFS